MDVEAIQQELAQLEQQKAEAKARLQSFRPAFGGRHGPQGRGGATPPHYNQGAGGPFRRQHSSGYEDAPEGPGGSARPAGVFARLAGGALRMRGGPAGRPAGPPGMAGDMDRMGPPRIRRPAVGDHDDRDGFRSRLDTSFRPVGGNSLAAEAPGSARSRPKLLSSAIVVQDSEANQGEAQAGADNDADADGAAAAGAGDSHKRKASSTSDEPAENGSMRKRNRRMFGALLGTLQRFRDEDAQFQNSDVAVKRVEALRKADERERSESERLRRKEAQARAAARDEELAKLSEISLAADTKYLELMFAGRIARKEKLAGFLVTKAHPPVYWSPAIANPITDKLAADQRDEVEQWKAGLLAELETEKAALVERSRARREEALARRAAREERLAAARAAGGTGTGALLAAQRREEEQDARDLEAGEYAMLQQQGEGDEGGPAEMAANGAHEQQGSDQEMEDAGGDAQAERTAGSSKGRGGSGQREVAEEDGEFGAGQGGGEGEEEGEASEGQPSAEREEQMEEEEDLVDMAARDKEADTVEDLLAS